MALTFSLAGPCSWSMIWSPGAPSPTPDLETGIFGMTQDGPQLYSSSGVETTVGPLAGLDTSIVLNTDTYTGSVVAWGSILGVFGSNYTSRGNAAVPGIGPGLDYSYTAGSIDNWGLGAASTLSAGDLTQYDAGGAIIAFRSSACPVVPTMDINTDGKAVALHAGGDVSVGGSTNRIPSTG